MTLHAAVSQLCRPHHHPLPTMRGLLRLLIVAACLSLALPFTGLAQTNDPAPLPPAAQEALNKGIIAAKVPDYLLAIRYFEDARKIAPQAPVIFMNLGIAESRIPGRELRAMAWFGAYLAATPDAPNAAAVKEQIAVLEVRNQSNVSRLINLMQDNEPDKSLTVVTLWAKAGDIKAALKTADLIADAYWKRGAQSKIAEAQAQSGDIAGALKTVDLIENEDSWKSRTLASIYEVQIKTGDIAGGQNTLASAQKSADRLQDTYYKSSAQKMIAETQTDAGDIAGARKNLESALKTADLIQESSQKAHILSGIKFSQDRIGFARAPGASRPPAIAVSDWLNTLDDDRAFNDCPLNTRPFLDFAGYLKSLPPSDRPGKVFDSLSNVAEKVIKAQNVIHKMLKQQAAR